MANCSYALYNAVFLCFALIEMPPPFLQTAATTAAATTLYGSLQPQSQQHTTQTQASLAHTNSLFGDLASKLDSRFEQLARERTEGAAMLQLCVTQIRYASAFFVDICFILVFEAGENSSHPSQGAEGREREPEGCSGPDPDTDTATASE